MSLPTLRFRAPVYGSSGYAAAARDFILALDATGRVPISIEPLVWNTGFDIQEKRERWLRLRQLDARLLGSVVRVIIGERAFLLRKGCLGLGKLLLVDAIVQLHQKVAFPDLQIVSDRDLNHVARQLRGEDGHLAFDIGVVGRLHRGREGRQLPRIEYHQHACDAREQCRNSSL